MQSADFSPIAHRYDVSRHLPEPILLSAYRRLEEAGVLAPSSQVLDIGCGTGQLSLPLAGLGYQVTGVDISAAMIERAQAKVRPSQVATFLVADATRLPFAAQNFDVTVVSKLFQHVSAWQRAIEEILRVTKPGGCVLHLMDHGAFRHTLRQHLERMADAAGYQNRYLGTRHSEEIHAYFHVCGSSLRQIDLQDLRWEKRITYAQALQEIQERLFAEFWGLPESVYEQFVRQLEEWVKAQPEGAETVEVLSVSLAIDIYTVASS